MIKRILKSLTKWLWLQELLERERAIQAIDKLECYADINWGDTLMGVTQAVYDKHCQIWLEVKERCEQELKQIFKK